MRLPEGYDKMSDEELKEKLLADYTESTVEYLIDVIRGRIVEDHPIY